MNKIIERITRLKSESVSSFIQQQKAMVPHDMSDAFKKYSTECFLDGTRTLMVKDKICLQMNYLPMKPVKNKEFTDMQRVDSSFIDLFNNEKIFPFAVFCNGRFIKWSNIRIIIDQNHYYIIINKADTEYTDILDHIEHGTLDVKVLSIPTNVEYNEKAYFRTDENIIFSFEEDGTVDPNGTGHIRFFTKNPNLYHREWVADGTVNAFNTGISNKYYLDPVNIIVFKNGLYYPSTTDTVSTVGPFVSIDKGQESAKYTFIVFYNSLIHKSNNNISRVDPISLQENIQKMNAGEAVPQWFTDLLIGFDFGFNKDLEYQENILNSIKSIMSYNYDLFSEVYISNSTFDIYRVDGNWILSHLNKDGYLDIPRRRYNEKDGYVVMLVNGELYKYYYTHKYYANRFIVSIQDIQKADIIEFFFFKNVCNDILDITVNEDDPYTEYNNRYRNGNMNIFYPQTDSQYFKFPEDGSQNFEIKHEFLVNDNGESKIVFDNPFYYGKKAKLAYNNQFRYYRYKFTEDDECINDIRVGLGKDFEFCPDYSKYMIYLNGRYMSTDQYRLVLPVNDTTPFYSYYIYLTKPINTGDILEIFYVPIMISDVATYETIETNGQIIVDTSRLNYGLTNKTYMIWINGKKIPDNHISNVSRDRVFINTDPGSINTVCITKYLEDIDILTDAFKENISLWDTIINGLTHEEICMLLGIDNIVLTDTQTPQFKDTYSITSVLWEVIRDWYMTNATIDTTEPFIYNYIDEDTESVINNNIDDGGNYILDAYNSNEETAIINRETQFP